MPRDEHPTVWSTEHGDLRKVNHKKLKVQSIPASQQKIYLHRETKGRGGKTVTLVKNLVLSENDLKTLAKKLKKACGSGGTIKDNIIIIQGDHRETIQRTLQKMGYPSIIAGG